MKKIDKSKDEILKELQQLQKENAELRANYGNDISLHLSPEDENIIRQLFENYIQMYASRDDNLTTYFSDNFSGFTGGGDFLVKDKSRWIDITRQDFAQVKDSIRIEIKDLAIQSLTKNIAVTTGFFNIHLPIKDQVLSREVARLVLIFRKEEAGWKITHSSISIPYPLVREGEVYPMKELAEQNKLLEELISERTKQLSEVNESLRKTNEELAREIEEHNKTAEEFRKINQKLQAIISATPDGIGMVSLDGTLEFVSDKLAEMNGYSIEDKEEFIGKSVFEFIDPTNHSLLRDNINRLLSGKMDRGLTEYLAVRKDNSRVYIDINSNVLLDSNNKPASILFVERDITERKKSDLLILKQHEQLQEHIATKDKFFSIIAHDLRSPFHSLLSASDILATEIENLSSDEIKSFSRGLNNSVRNLYSLLENLLQWSMMQRKMLVYNPRDINLNEVVSEIIAITNQIADKKGVNIYNNVDAETAVYADADMLRSIVQNLVMNAIKFTSDGGEITISSAQKESFVEISVQDNGIGIEPERVTELFNFDKISTSIGTAGEKGTGLGLSLCKEFIERNDGNIRVDSDLGKGSKFTFTLRKANS